MQADRNIDIGISDTLAAAGGLHCGMQRSSVYHFECFDKDGNLKWEETQHNLVTTVGLNDSLDKHFKGSSYSATWYVGLTSASPTLSAADTAASKAWTEIVAYSESVRQTLTLGTVSGGSVSNTASKATFSINGSTTVGGAFVISNSTKSGTTGILYGEAQLSADRSLISGDTLTITVTLTAS
jgi:hypothetical protein